MCVFVHFVFGKNRFQPSSVPEAKWRETMDTLSEVSCEVRLRAGCVPIPLDSLEKARLSIGSMLSVP